MEPFKRFSISALVLLTQLKPCVNKIERPFLGESLLWRNGLCLIIDETFMTAAPDPSP